MRYIALDFGLARTGVAYAEHESAAVIPIQTIQVGDFAKKTLFYDAIAALLATYKCDRCVIGFPMPLSGEETLICRQIRNAAKKISHRTSVPLYFENEALTSEEAWDDLRSFNVARKKRKYVLDQVAACRILQSFLAHYASLGDAYLLRMRVPPDAYGSARAELDIQS